MHCRWRDFEASFGNTAQQGVPAKLMPKRVKRKRTVEAGGPGGESVEEEFYDYVRVTQRPCNHSGSDLRI